MGFELHFVPTAIFPSRIPIAYGEEEGVLKLGELLGEKVSLTLECCDRIYLNGYLPTLQVGGQVVRFLCEHRGNPIPSPALLEKMTKEFVRRVEGFAATEKIPVIKAEKGVRKEELVRPLMEAARREGSEKVVAILVAQEKSTSFRGYREPGSGAPRFGFRKVSVCVKCFYFYIYDASFGPAFL